MLISIIIPTKNRVTTLRNTLISINRQKDLVGIEVLVIDNGSTDETNVICAEISQVYKVPFRYYYDPEPGLLTGRHLGTGLAKGEIICFLDDDVTLDSSWTSGVKDAFLDPEVHLATGPCLPKYETEPPEWLKYFWRKVRGKGIACSWLSLINLGNKKIEVEPNLVWGLNFCIRKATLKTLGGFHPDNISSHLQMFQGDGETGLTIKAKKAGYTTIYHPQIKLLHFISAERLTFEYFKKRAFYQGICNSFTLLKAKYSKEKEILNIKQKIMTVLRPLNKLLLLSDRFTIPKEIRDLIDELKQKEKEGFEFHQKAFKNNPKVREWVKRVNYWDYRLPN